MIRFFVLLLLTACIGASPAKAISGNDVLTSCETLLRDMQPVGTNGVRFTRDGEMCWWYITALMDAASFGDGQQRPVLKVCPPKDSNQLQLIRIYVNYARQNPAHLHHPGIVVAQWALYQVFPCPDR